MSFEFRLKRTLRGLDHPPALWNPVWMGPLEPREIAEFLAPLGSVIGVEIIREGNAEKPAAIVRLADLPVMGIRLSCA